MTLQETLTSLRDERARSVATRNWGDEELAEWVSVYHEYQNGFNYAQDLLLPLIEKMKVALEMISTSTDYVGEGRFNPTNESIYAREALSELKKLEDGLK